MTKMLEKNQIKERIGMAFKSIFRTEAITNKDTAILKDCELSVLKEFGVKLTDKYGTIKITQNYTDNEKMEAMLGIARGDCLDSEALIELDDKVFDMKRACHKAKNPGGIDVTVIAEEIVKNEKYKEILIANNRMHSPERARLVGLFYKALKEESTALEDLENCVKQVSQSFENLINYSNDEKYLNRVWIKYMNMVGFFCDITPKSLLEYINKDNYRILFNYMRNNLKNSKGNHTSRETDNYTKMISEVSMYILENLEPNDIPSCIYAGRYYQQIREYDRAEEIFEKYVNKKISFNIVSALGNCYEEHAAYLVNQNYEKGYSVENIEKIAELNVRAEKLYENSIKEIMDAMKTADEAEIFELKKNHISILCKAARLAKKCEKYEQCSLLLESIDGEYPEYYRILTEKGMLLQSKGRRNRNNPYYDLSKSVEQFKNAYELIEKGTFSKSEKIHVAKSILMPMANSLFELEEYKQSLEICSQILNLDKKEHNAKSLIKRIEKIQWVEV